MKDILGRQIKVGDLITYAILAGRSANLAIYEVCEIKIDKLKVRKIIESYGAGPGRSDVNIHDGSAVQSRFAVWDASINAYRKKTREEFDAEVMKTSTISMGKRALVLDQDNASNIREKMEQQRIYD